MVLVLTSLSLGDLEPSCTLKKRFEPSEAERNRNGPKRNKAGRNRTEWTETEQSETERSEMEQSGTERNRTEQNGTERNLAERHRQQRSRTNRKFLIAICIMALIGFYSVLSKTFEIFGSDTNLYCHITSHS